MFLIKEVRLSLFKFPLALIALLLSVVLFSGEARSATIVVQSMNDAASSGAACTLRDAIASVDAAGDNFGCSHTGNYAASDTITVPSGTYTLTATLPLLKNVIINGNGSANTTIDGNNTYLVFSLKTASSFTLNGMTIENGNGTPSGGIDLNDANATLNITNCVIRNNTANNNFGGGGLNAYGAAVGTPFTVNISGSTFSGNSNNTGTKAGLLLMYGTTMIFPRFHGHFPKQLSPS